MSKWQPIETAPRDGKGILACSTETGLRYLVSWQPDLEFMPDGHTSYWENLAAKGISFDENTLTHWMELPAPPQPPEGEEK